MHKLLQRLNKLSIKHKVLYANGVQGARQKDRQERERDMMKAEEQTAKQAEEKARQIERTIKQREQEREQTTKVQIQEEENRT